MAVSMSAYLGNVLNKVLSMGKKVMSSDFTLEPQGYEKMYLLTSQFPLPVLSSGEPAEYYMPLGIKGGQPTQSEIFQQGSIAFYETTAFELRKFMSWLAARGGVCDFNFYHGTPEKYTDKGEMVSAFIVLEKPDLDWENKTQVVKVTGTIYYYYFGEHEAGNIKSVDGAN